MSNGNPYPPPAPRQMVELLMLHAWRDDVDDELRRVLEHGAETICSLLDRLVAQARAHEQAEAKR